MILTTGAIALTLQWGVTAVAAGYAASTVVRLPIIMRLVGSLAHFSLRRFMRELVPSLAGTAVLLVVGAVMERGLDAAGVPNTPGLVAALCVAYTAFLVTLRLGWPESAREAGTFIRLVRGGSPRPAAAAA
jgi:hypothetical protein